MKLILTSEVTGLGEPGDVVEVKDGYGRNYLIPRGLALLWTRGGEKQIVSIKRARSARSVRDLDHAKEIKAAVEGKQVTLVARAGDGGRLFGSITAGEVADAVKSASGQDLDRRRIELGHIKATGSHTATVRLHPEVVATINLQVVSS